MININVSILLFLLVFSFAKTSIATETHEQHEQSITISLIHSASGEWQQLSAADKKSLLKKLEESFRQYGFTSVETVICQGNNNAASPCVSNSNSDLYLSIVFSAIKTGKPKKGLSFTIESTDPRAPVIGKVDVIPVACRLSDKGQSVIDMNRSEEPVKSTYLFKDNFNADYLMNKLNSACYPLLARQGFIKSENLAKGVERIDTEYPDVYIEKRVSSVDKDDIALKKSSLSMIDTENDTVQMQKVEGESHAEYIIHNRGDKLTIEFGQHRRE